MNSDIFRYLFYALLHSVWLGLLIAGALALYLRGSRPDRAQQRYAVSCAAMLVLVLAVFVTWSVLEYEPAADAASSTSADAANAIEPITRGPAQSSPSGPDAHTRPSAITPASVNWPLYGLTLWALGVSLMLWRLIYRINASTQLCCRGQAIDSPEIIQLVARLCGHMGIARPIKVLFSNEMLVPCAVGCLKPVIVLPMSVATGIPPEQLEAILAHELAHIRRWDYWINCAQLVVESLLFFNPAVWWISYHMRQEREACCDAMAAQGMGHPMDYVQALVAWIGQAQQAPLNAAVAFSGPAGKGRLVDRVKRLVVRDYQASLNLSWVTSVLMLALSALVLVGLKLGSDRSVALAAQILTPRQRVEKAERLAKDFDRDHSRDGQEGLREKEKVRISGQVTTYDGKALPQHSHSNSFSEGLNTSASQSFGIDANGMYSDEVYAGQAWLLFTVEGYAPQGIGPISTVDTNSIENLDVVLQAGFDASIQIVDVDGKPIEQARVYGGYKYLNDCYSLTIDERSNAEGMVHFAGAAGGNVHLKCRVMAEGFGECEKEIELKPDQTHVIVLSAIEPATGIVVSKKTGLPIANAEIRPVVRRLGNARYMSSNRGEVLARTGTDGQFKLTRLVPNAIYAISARAPGYGYRLIDAVSAGQQGIKIELNAPACVKGQIVGPLEKLPKTEDGNAYISYCESAKFKGSSDRIMTKEAIVSIQDGKGYFELTDLWGTHVSIGSDYYTKQIALTGEDQDVTINLIRPENQKDTKLIKRRVIFKFVLKENASSSGEPNIVAPSGVLEVGYVKINANGIRQGFRQYVDIEDGQAICDVVTLDGISCAPHDIKGFWFKEKDIEITAAEDPLLVTIPCIEAGAIVGQVQGVHRGSVSLNVVKKPAATDSSLLSVQSQSLGLDGKFMLSPVPLGGTYRVVASQQKTYMVSEAVTLSREAPFQSIQMTLPSGKALLCTVLDPNGLPCPGLEYSFDYDVKGLGGGGIHSGLSTNASGQIVLSGVNFAAPMSYSIIMKPKGYQPVKHLLDQDKLDSVIHLKKGLTVEGVVYDEGNEPLADIEVYCMLYHNEAWRWVTYVDAEAKTDAQGRFRFGNLPPGEYSLGCRGAQTIGDTHIVAGQKQKAILRVKQRKRS
jgi:beta-lactamase regulating signal transducer with metallopeptidase domain